MGLNAETSDRALRLRPFGDLPGDMKQTLSHRARAAAKVRDYLRSLSARIVRTRTEALPIFFGGTG